MTSDRRTVPAPAANDRTARVLLAIIDDLTVERDEEGLLRQTLEHVVGALDLSGGLILLATSDDDLEAVAAARERSPEPEHTRALARRAYETWRPAVADLPGGGWLAATPLAARQSLLGALALHEERSDSVAPEHELLEAIGRQIGTGLENVRLYAELRASSNRAEILSRITGTLTSSLDLGTVIPAFARELAAVQSFDRLACGFVNDSGDYIEVTGHPEDATWGLGSVIPVVGSGPGSVVMNGVGVVTEDLVHSHRYIEDMRLLEEGIRSYVLLPLDSRGRTVGVLCLGSATAGVFDESSAMRLQPLVDHVSLALENVRLFQKTRELSITDEVTPLYNFRFFHQILDRELKLVDRYQSCLSLIFFDLDNFKPINDQFGHLRGSRVLREVGFLLRMAVRETDYPCRYGGDEFCVILPQTDGAAASVLAEKLRTLIVDHVFLQEERINATLGASVGVATYPVEARTKEALVRLADERMYLDKGERRTGR